MIVEILATMTHEGSLYAVDARLRPFGGEGDLAQPMDRLGDYFASSAATWELQAFLKARPLAGDLDLGWDVARRIEGMIFHRAAQIDLARQVLEMKLKLERDATARARGGTDIKAGPGGLATIQFAIQFLQLRHGIASPTHKRTTRLLATLRTAGLLDEDAYRVFFMGYRFLRLLEHQLRLIHGRALSRLPAGRGALDEIAMAMGYPDAPGAGAGDRLASDLETHRIRIETTFRCVLEETTQGRAPRA